MDKNIHSEDEYFKKAYQHLEDEPSPDVWSKLDANLTKQDAARYRKKFLTWRSVACLLFFMLGSLFLYNLVKTSGNINISNRDSSAVFNKKPQATAQSPLASKKTKPEIEKPGITKPDVAEKAKTDSINYTLLSDNQNHAQRSNPKVDFEDKNRIFNEYFIRLQKRIFLTITITHFRLIKLIKTQKLDCLHSPV